MQFTGNELSVKRNFYTQTGDCGFVMAATVDTTTGAYHFGLSGVDGALDFKMESGRICYGNTYIHHYRSFEPFTIEAQFSSGALNVLKDNAALVYGLPKPTGQFDYFYFNRVSTNMAAEFAVQISGDNTPTYSISDQGYLYSTGQKAVTGWFVNSSAFPIRIFDSSIQSSAIYDFGKLATTIAPGSSGAFAYTGDYTTIDFSQPIITTFATNFGNIETTFSIIDTASLGRFVQLTAPTDFSFNTSNVLNRDISWLNYSGGVVVGNFDTSLVVQLRYMTGLETFTGAWNIYTGVSATNMARLSSSTGLFSGSGNFAANSSINLNILYSGQSGNQVQLVISGNEINNPINQTLTFTA
jgi:hypothetical protein